VLDAQTTSSYIIKREYAFTLRSRFIQAAALLNLNTCKTVNEHAIDIYWKPLQKASTWLVFEPRIGRQAPSYSDIGRKNVSYGVKRFGL
jgi:hypothetical protein